MLGEPSGRYQGAGLAIASIGQPAKAIPAWAGLLRDIAFVRAGTPAVILLPATTLIGETIALLCARERSADLDLSAAALLGCLALGARVRILPDEGIYEFGGVEAGGFWLHPLNSRGGLKGGRFRIPEKEAVRLEPSRRKRPFGKANRHEWGPLAPTGWDQFAGSNLRGNPALSRLLLVLIGVRKDFADALGHLGFACVPGTNAQEVADGLPWGRVDENGDLDLLQPSSASGQPLIAVARDHVSARRLAEKFEPGSLVIISGRPDDALADRTSVENLAERHPCLLVAPGRMREDFLRRRSDNWLVTELSGSPALKAAAVGIPALDRVATASTWMTRPASSLPERSRELENAFGLLTDFNSLVAPHLDGEDETSEAARLLSQMFFQASDWLMAPTAEDLEEFRADSNALRRLSLSLQSIAGKKAADGASAIVAVLEHFVELISSQSATPKGNCLLRLAKAAQNSSSYRQVIVTGNRRTANAILVFLDVMEAPMNCVTPNELAMLEDVQRVNVLSVMRREAFMRVVDPWAAPEIMFLGYQHEVEIYQKRLATRQRLIDSLRPDASIVAKLPPLAPLGVPTAQPVSPLIPITESDPLPITPRPLRRPELRGSEQSKPARFCRFSGRSWMAMTDDHFVARVQVGNGNNAKVASAPCRDIEVGDLILVREGGEKDIVREMAEQLVGHNAYAQLRTQAEHWRRALRASGHTPERLRQLLAEEGVERGLPTLRYWMAEDGPIGPHDPDVSIPLIAAALGEDCQSGKWQACREAIHHVWRYHLNAGTKLTRVLMDECGDAIFEHSEHETAFKLSVGTVWLLEIEYLETERCPWPYTQVNRIQWESDIWRRRLLRKAVTDRATSIDVTQAAFLDTATGRRPLEWHG